MATTRKYAEGSDTPVESSQMEAKRLLKRYGAEDTRITDGRDRSALEFVLADRLIRFVVEAPPADEYPRDRTGKHMSQRQHEQGRQKEYRRRWRSLILRLKAKLEAVANNDVAMEEEFLGNLVLPGGQTVGEILLPQIEEVYRTGQVPSLMPNVGQRAIAPYVIVEDAPREG